MSLCKTVVRFLNNLTSCENQNEFLGNKYVILASEYFVGCDSNEKRYVYNILNHIFMLLNNMCKRYVAVLCICKPLTNNLAESAITIIIKNF